MQDESFPHRSEGEQSHAEDIAAQALQFGEQFPQIADSLREYAERVSRDYEAEQSPDHPRLSIDEQTDKDKRDYWELLTILAQAVPDLPIVELHDEAVAKIDAAVREGKQQKDAIKRATDTTRSTMGDTAIDYHITGKDDDLDRDK
jgi:hypothetical protein